jgi:hypothetical protein
VVAVAGVVGEPGQLVQDVGERLGVTVAGERVGTGPLGGGRGHPLRCAPRQRLVQLVGERQDQPLAAVPDGDRPAVARACGDDLGAVAGEDLLQRRQVLDRVDALDGQHGQAVFGHAYPRLGEAPHRRPVTGPEGRLELRRGWQRTAGAAGEIDRRSGLLVRAGREVVVEDAHRQGRSIAYMVCWASQAT